MADDNKEKPANAERPQNTATPPTVLPPMPYFDPSRPPPPAIANLIGQSSQFATQLMMNYYMQLGATGALFPFRPPLTMPPMQPPFVPPVFTSASQIRPTESGSWSTPPGTTSNAPSPPVAPAGNLGSQFRAPNAPPRFKARIPLRNDRYREPNRPQQQQHDWKRDRPMQKPWKRFDDRRPGPSGGWHTSHGRDKSPERSTSATRRERPDRLPASYRRGSSESNRRHAENGRSSSEGSSDSSDESDSEKEDEERVPMPSLDFEGVGSDISETEEEDNPPGTTEGDKSQWFQMAPAKLYFSRPNERSSVVEATEKLKHLEYDFERMVLSVSRNARQNQAQLEPPPSKPFAHRCCHHHKEHSDSSESNGNTSSEEGELSSSSNSSQDKTNRRSTKLKPARRTKHQHGEKSNSTKDTKKKKDNDHSSHGSDCSSDSGSETEHERFKLALKEMTRKQEHPARLHSDLWFNETGQLNDGPLCRCSWKARQSGIAHSIYPGEKTIELCDPTSNNLTRLYHYRVVISPLENIKGKVSTTIPHDGHNFYFEGFSILSHEPLPTNLPVCTVIRWNFEYSISFSKEEAPELFTVQDLNLFWNYLFVEILELYDLQLLPPNSNNSCPIFHVLPRFVRPLEEGGQEILPTCYVLKYLMSNYKPLISEDALNDLPSWSQEKWDKLVEVMKDQLVTNPNKRPSSVRVDCLDRMTTDRYPIIVHFGVRPAVLTYTGNPQYQKAWKQYVKFRHLLMMKAKLTTDDRAKLAQKERHLQKLKAKASLKRDVTVEVSSQGFYSTGIYTDVVQHSLMLLVAFCHIRFHWSLRCFEGDRIKYKFKNRALLELAFTHPSYRQNYGTNPDHARNTLSNCGIRQPEYGNKRMQQILSRKRGINTLIDIMSRMGSKKVKQSQVTNNERLEYLGDAVIEFLSTIHLFHMFPDLQEGGLATYRSSLVQNKHLALLAKKLGMDEFMLYAHGPDLCHETDLKHAMANAFEAVMGALFLDGGVDVVDRVFGEALFRKLDDEKLHWVWFNLPKHPLQEQEPEGDRHWIGQVAVLQQLTEFEKQTGILFKHIRLLARAFTRKNVGYNFLTLGHNQRLEFLGDTVLQLITSEYLYKHFPEHHEGHLSLLRSCLVNNKTQSVICDDLGMTKYVVNPPAFLKTGPPELRMKDKADLVESFLGAMYVDRGLEFCKVFCKVCFYPRLKYFIMSQKWNDPKSQLQQCCLTLRNPDGGEPDIPTYKVISVEGPTNTRLYKVAVYFKGQRLAAGGGHSVQEAEMKAAEEALKRRADLFPHLEKQRYFIEHRFRKELPGNYSVQGLKRRMSRDGRGDYDWKRRSVGYQGDARTKAKENANR